MTNNIYIKNDKRLKILFNLYNRVLFARIKFKSNAIKNKLLNRQQLDFYIKNFIN